MYAFLFRVSFIVDAFLSGKKDKRCIFSSPPLGVKGNPERSGREPSSVRLNERTVQTFRLRGETPRKGLQKWKVTSVLSGFSFPPFVWRHALNLAGGRDAHRAAENHPAGFSDACTYTRRGLAHTQADAGCRISFLPAASASRLGASKKRACGASPVWRFTSPEKRERRARSVFALPAPLIIFAAMEGA